MEELKELFETLQKDWHVYKSEIKAFEESGRQTAGRLAELDQKLEKIEAQLQKTEDLINKVRSEKQELEAQVVKLSRPVVENTSKYLCKALELEATRPDAQERKVAFWRALYEPDRMPSEQKALTLKDPEAGGYLAPPDFVNELIKGVIESAPVLDLARVRLTASGQMVITRRSGTITAVRRGELESKSETTGLAYASEAITLPEVYCYQNVSVQLLEDAAFNLEAELYDEFRTAIAAKLSSEFVSGLGPSNNQMEGLLTNSSVQSVISGSASALTADGLITLVESLPAAYKANAKMLLNRSTLAACRKLQDTAGTFVWAPGTYGRNDADQPTLAGVPYVVCAHMPNVGSGAYPIVVGDFKRGYLIGMKAQLAIKRLEDSTLDQAGYVAFSGRMRVGGGVVLPEAILKQVVSAS
jgi:HK97 family phage major capsid protein